MTDATSSLPNLQPHPNARFHPDVALQPLATMLYIWRTSGLLQAMPAEDLKSLLFVLSFTTASGECQPTLHQLAHAMQVSEAKARRRLEHLTQFHWKEQPLVLALRRGNGSDAYSPVPGHIDFIAADEPPLTGAALPGAATDEVVTDQAASTATPGKSQEQAIEQPATPPLTQREKIIEASRRKYTRPRAEVERMVAEQLGYAHPLSPAPLSPVPTVPSPSAPSHSATAGHFANSQQQPYVQPRAGDEIKTRLLAVGVEEDRADSLLTHCTREAIKRQLDWLPYRDARNPAAFLVAAIEHDYEPPLTLRQAPNHQEQRPQVQSGATL